jgi:hypothetical protein
MSVSESSDLCIASANTAKETGQIPSNVRFIGDDGFDISVDGDLDSFLENVVALKEDIDGDTLFCVDKDYIKNSLLQGFDTVDIMSSNPLQMPKRLRLPAEVIDDLRSASSDESESLSDVRRRAVDALQSEFSESVLHGERTLSEEEQSAGGHFAVERPTNRSRAGLRSFLEGCTDNLNLFLEKWTDVDVDDMTDDEIESFAKDIVRFKFFPQGADEPMRWCYDKSHLLEQWKNQQPGKLPENRVRVPDSILRSVFSSEELDQIFASQESFAEFLAGVDSFEALLRRFEERERQFEQERETQQRYLEERQRQREEERRQREEERQRQREEERRQWEEERQRQRQREEERQRQREEERQRQERRREELRERRRERLERRRQEERSGSDGARTTSLPELLRRS